MHYNGGAFFYIYFFNPGSPMFEKQMARAINNTSRNNDPLTGHEIIKAIHGYRQFR